MKMKEAQLDEINFWLLRYKRITAKRERHLERTAKAVEAMRDMDYELKEIKEKLAGFGIEIDKEETKDGGHKD